MARLFGTDGVRGEANIELTPELAYRLGRAATLYFGEDSETQPKILIGRDTRISGQMFEAALSAGICSAGDTRFCWCDSYTGDCLPREKNAGTGGDCDLRIA